MAKKMKSNKSCCAELKKAVGYKNSSIMIIREKLVTLCLGNIQKTPKEATERAKKLMKAIFPESTGKSIPVKLTGKIPVIVQIKYCPFCGTKIY